MHAARCGAGCCARVGKGVASHTNKSNGEAAAPAESPDSMYQRLSYRLPLVPRKVVERPQSARRTARITFYLHKRPNSRRQFSSTA